MVHIISLVMEKMQFNHFPIKSMGVFWCHGNQNQQADHNDFSYMYLELSLPKQHLTKLGHIASVVLEELSFKKFLLFF